MAVRCAHCGEELLGAVNRCWNCGNMVTSRPGPAELPPVRRDIGNATAAPEAPSGEVIEADFDPTYPASEDEPVGEVDPSVLGEPNQAATMSGALRAVSETGTRDTSSPPKSSKAIYYGSPFAAKDQPPVRANLVMPASAPIYPEHAAASGGAIACLCLGVMSLAVILTFWETPGVAIALSVLGICMGIWGMYSNRRGFAGLGLLLCIAAFGMSSFSGVVQVYTLIHGVSPFQEVTTDDLPME